jgi:hypothetical protein
VEGWKVGEGRREGGNWGMVQLGGYRKWVKVEKWVRVGGGECKVG